MLACCAVFSFSTAAAQATGEIWVVPIETEITGATTSFVRERVKQANAAQPQALVFYLNTPGGAVDAMQDIVGMILHDTHVPTIAVVQNAFSAGALIAMAAERLAMLPGSAIGAALPIQVTPTGITNVDEKFSSALRGEFRSVAETRGRNARVAEGMVDDKLDLPGISAPGELITLTSEQAVTFEIADIRATSLTNALELFGYRGFELHRLEPTLTERVAGFLSQPLIASALLVLGLGGLLLELFSPGFGVPGILGLVFLVLFAVAAYFGSPATALDITILVAGVVLIVIELVVLPGFGVAGVLGIAAIIVAIVRIFQEAALPMLGYTVVFGGALLLFLLWAFPHSKVAGALRLSTRLGGGTADLADPDKPGPHQFIGKTGIASSDLRPAGVVRFGDERVDVVSEGEFITAGSTVTVIAADSNRLVVRLVQPQAEEPSTDGASQEGSIDG